MQTHFLSKSFVCVVKIQYPFGERWSGTYFENFTM
jgi:hypothetical protein